MRTWWSMRWGPRKRHFPSVSVVRAMHVGPDASGAGGIASVLSVFSKNERQDLDLEVLASWSPSARLWGLQHMLRCAASLVFRRPDILHVHLSKSGSFAREGFLLLVG